MTHPSCREGSEAKESGDLRTLRTHLRRLRSKLGEDTSNPTCFFAEPRVGYRMAKGEGAGGGRAASVEERRPTDTMRSNPCGSRTFKD